MDLQHIALSQLKIATVNVRHARKAPDISDILPSIRARGVLQPLLVRPDGKSFEVIAGRRRYFAAHTVAKEQGVEACEVLLPCAVSAGGDDADAIEASLIENVARAPMDELQEYEAYARLLKQGKNIAAIAATFGVTELYVKQRFALANLHAGIKDAYRSGDIEPEDLRLLTAASKSQQKEWVAALEAARDPNNPDAEGAPCGYRLKRWLLGSAQIATRTALFPLADYKADIIADLFGEVSYFADSEAFWTLQNAAIAALRDELAAEGWKVVLLQKAERFHVWQHVETPKEEGGNAYVEVRESGEVEVHRGFLPEVERAPGDGDDEGSDGEGSDGEAAPSVRPELTKAGENYLTLQRHAIVRAELLARPDLALRLVTAHMIAGSPLWSVRPEPQRADKETTAQSVTASKAQIAFEAERLAVLQALDIEASFAGSVTRGNGDPYWRALVFARLLAMSEEAVLRVLTLVMAETLNVGSVLVEAAGVLIKPDVAQWWRADEAFLDLVRDRQAVNAMLSEVAGKSIADANITESAKVQKKIVRDCLEGEGRE
ncbi:MAG: ParB/RepB/Spo0J family partition protein, partial [Bradyrhizobium sp.]